MLVVVATDNEYRVAKKRYLNVIKTGVGYGNVYKKLKNYDRNTFILNFGYAGSNTIEAGEVCLIKRSLNYHPNVEFKERIYDLKVGEYDCYTSNDFVTKTDIKEPVVFDMELYAILSMGFKDVISIKIISDNLNLKEYEEKIK